MIIGITGLAPQQRLIIVTLMAVFVTALSIAYVLSVPQLGIDWKADFERNVLVVENVSPDSPNHGKVVPGERAVAVKQDNGGLIPLFADTIHEDPDLLSYQRYNILLEQQNRLIEELEDGTINVITSDQRVVTLTAEQQAGSGALAYLLIKAGYGWVALLVAAGIWAYSPGRIETKLFFLSGVSIFSTTLTLGTYGGRELAISGDVLAVLMSLNHLAVLQVSASLIALFWVYPIRQSRFPGHYVILAIGVLAWLSDQLQLATSPQYTVYSVIVVGFILGVMVLGRQWRLTRNHPIERASLKWCALSVFTGCLLLTTLIMLPPALGVSRGLPLSLSLISVLVLYLGMAAGLTRYRLFDLEQWWFKTWIWFFGGVLVVLLDVALIFGLGLAGEMALALSLALAGWFYFPLRQALMSRLGRNRQNNFDLALKKLVDNLFSASSGGRILSAWPDLLKQTFSPLSIRPIKQPADAKPVAVSNDGVQMTLAALDVDQPGFLLEFADDGRRLFSPDDLRIASLLRAISEQALFTVRAREDGAEAERRRIMRDLHDDVGGRILSVLHNASDERQASLARNALQSLREALQALDQESLSWLVDCVHDWNDLCLQRCKEMGVQLRWSFTGDLYKEQAITVRQRINLSRIIHEALTNAFRHAHPDYVQVSVKIDNENLYLKVTNDGVVGLQTENNNIAKRGLNNMRTRSEELGGHFHFHINGATATIDAVIPLDGA